MHFPTHLFIPLVCGFVYVVGALCLKRAAEYGVGVGRTTFVVNLCMALSIQPVWWLAESAPWPAE